MSPSDTRFDEILRELEPQLDRRGAAGQSKYGEITTYVADLLGMPSDQIHPATARMDNTLRERLGSGRAGTEHHEVCLLILREEASLDSAEKVAPDYVASSQRGFDAIAIIDKQADGWDVRSIVGSESSPIPNQLATHFAAASVHEVEPADPSRLPSPERFDELVSEINLSSPARGKYEELKEFLASLLRVDQDRIHVSTGASNNITVRPVHGEERTKHHEFGLYLLTSGSEGLDYTIRQARQRLVKPGEGGYAAFAIAMQEDGTWTIKAVVEGAVKTEVLKQVFPDVRVESKSLADLSEDTATDVGDAISTVPLVMDERVKRMVRLSIASAKAVMLVGPPGTAKTRLLEEVIREIGEDSAAHGFSNRWTARWVTPEESWTTRDLVGGETVTEAGELRFRPGYVLEAIKSDQWLVLDEANRADMDKIFGGLLTWLSGKSVQLGRTSTAVDAPAVELGWAKGPDSSVEGAGRLDEDLEDPDEIAATVKFLAGSEWRLLGTYNALDAQRVFRFGQALGRRFVRVPIPLISVEEFAQVLSPMVTDLPPSVERAVRGLYEEHYESANLALGPAVFLWIPDYVREGLRSPAISFTSVEEEPAEYQVGEEPAETEADEDSPSYEGVGSSPAPEEEAPAEEDQEAIAGAEADGESLPEDASVEAASEEEVRRLVAEAYLAAAGAWLANAEDEELDGLGQRIVEEQILPSEEWEWVRRLLTAMR